MLTCLALQLPTATARADDSNKILAKVDNQPIERREVERELATALGTKRIDDAARRALESATLEAIIDRRACAAWLARNKQSATPDEITQRRKTYLATLTSRNEKQADDLRRRKMTEADLTAELTWQATWSKYFATNVTDDTLAKHFAGHRRDFDGTELRIRHLFLKPTDPTSKTDREKLRAQAAEIRREIIAGKLTFVDAVRKYSQGPSKEKDGDLGWLARHGDHVEAFARAAFALNVGQVSEPVATPHGVHLITCTEIRPGKKTWPDVREELQTAIAAKLFKELTAKARPTCKIERLTKK